jgi:hypothetical protein
MTADIKVAIHASRKYLYPKLIEDRVWKAGKLQRLSS